MKKMLIITFMSLFYIFGLSSFNVEATELNVEEITHLESLGFTKEEISKMSAELIEENLAINGEVVSVDEKFFKIIESEIFNNNINPQNDKKFVKGFERKTSNNNIGSQNNNNSIVIELDKDTYLKEVKLEEAKRAAERNNGSVSIFADTDKHQTSYKTVTTTIVSLTQKQQYRLKTSIVWHIMPSNRKIDVIGTSINSSFWSPSPNSQRGQQSATVRYSCNKYKYPVTDYYSGSTLWSKGPSGYTLSIDLQNDIVKSYACYSEEVVALSAFAYYTAEKLASTSQIDAYGKYLHQETSIQITPNVTFYPLTFGVSATQSSKFTESTTHAQVKF